MKANNAAIILRWGLAFVFFYAAIDSLMSPELWMGYLPGFIVTVISPRLLLSILSLYQLILAGFLFWGKKVYWSSLLATASFAAVVLLDLEGMPFVFQYVGLAFAALALFEMTKHDETLNHELRK